MHKLVCQRLALVALIGVATTATVTAPSFAQDKMMGGKMSNGKMMDDKMIMSKMDGMKMSKSQKMMMKKDMMGMSMMQKNGMMTKMSGGKMMMGAEMRRINWYKKSYGGDWRNHYKPGV